MQRARLKSGYRWHRLAAVVAAAWLTVDDWGRCPLAWAEPTSQAVPAAKDSADPMWVRTFPLDECRHALLIVDPIQRHVAIYHVDTVAGTLTLKSSRDISGDLQLGDFNAHEPKPATLRKILDMSAPAAAPRQSP